MRQTLSGSPALPLVSSPRGEKYDKIRADIWAVLKQREDILSGHKEAA